VANDDPGDGRRRRLEGVIPELIKRAVEIGVEKAASTPEAMKHLVGELKLPKEAAAYILQQVDDTKNGVLRVAGKEIQNFLQETNLAGEIKKALTTLQFEINTTIRFTPNDSPGDASSKSAGASGAEGGAGGSGGGADDAQGPMPRPEVKTELFMKRDGDRPREQRRGPRKERDS
jgi:hypothetical protein